MLKQLHRGTKARVFMSGMLLDEIPIDNRLKQDVLASTLFLIFFSVMLIHVFHHYEKGILLEFKITGRVSNLRTFNFKSETFHTLFRKILYNDGIDFLALIVDNRQHTVDLFAASCMAYG